LFRCKRFDPGSWGINQHFSGSKCESEQKSIAQNLFITIICVSVFLIIALILLVIIERRRKSQMNDSLDIEDAKNSMELDYYVEISDKALRVPSNKSNYVDTSDRFIRLLILKIG
jgi:hypothetical protein